MPRLDLTAEKIHTLAPATKKIISNLEEPLTIRAYISKKTHPLLQPLVPQVKDLLAEYQAAASGRVLTEVVDPRDYPELEEEAGRRFKISPQPLQISDRYEASVVSAYFGYLGFIWG